MSLAQFSEVFRNPIWCFFLGGGWIGHTLFIMLQRWDFHRKKKITLSHNKMSAAPLCVSINTNISTESKNLTYVQLCCTSLLTDWLIHFTLSIAWILHSQQDLAKWPERIDNWQKTSGFANIKRGSLNHQIGPQGHTNMDSDLTANQYRESCRQSKVAALFLPVMFALSDHLLLTNRDVPSELYSPT